MSSNPFEKWSEPLPPRLQELGFSHRFVSISPKVTISYVHRPSPRPPLVLLPAQMGIWRTYEKVTPTLSRHFEVFIVEVPGHGSSSWMTGHYSWDSVGQQLGLFLQQVVGRPALVAGNSSGGIFALWLAAHFPEQVSAIVLEDAPIFSAELPRFKEHDRFVYQGLAHAVEVLEKPNRKLADYFRGQELPVSPTRVKRMPDWVIDRLIDPGVRRWKEQHPGEPSGFSAWWAPRSFGDFFRSLSMFDPDFARAFVDGRFYGDFSHEQALRGLRIPILLLHAKWLRVEPYGLVGALDDEDVAKVVRLAPQTIVRRSKANHVIHRYDAKKYIQEIVEFADLVASKSGNSQL